MEKQTTFTMKDISKSIIEADTDIFNITNSFVPVCEKMNINYNDDEVDIDTFKKILRISFTEFIDDLPQKEADEIIDDIVYRSIFGTTCENVPRYEQEIRVDLGYECGHFHAPFTLTLLVPKNRKEPEFISEWLQNNMQDRFREKISWEYWNEAKDKYEKECLEQNLKEEAKDIYTFILHATDVAPNIVKQYWQNGGKIDEDTYKKVYKAKKEKMFGQETTAIVYPIAKDFYPYPYKITILDTTHIGEDKSKTLIRWLNGHMNNNSWRRPYDILEEEDKQRKIINDEPKNNQENNELNEENEELEI